MNAEWWKRHHIARRRMRRAAVTAIAMALLAAVRTAMRSDESVGVLAYPLAFAMWTLGVGMYTRSRVCAVLLLAGEMASRVYGLVVGNPAVWVTIGAAVFGFIYFQGLLGALEHHRLEAERGAAGG